MNINQIISKEEKDEAFKALNNKTAKVIGVVWPVAFAFLLVLSVLGIVCFLILKNYTIVGCSVVLAVVAVAELKNILCSNKSRNTLKYIKHIDEILEHPFHYSVKADDERITINDKVSIKWENVIITFMCDDIYVFGTRYKNMAFLKLDDEQKKEVYSLVKKYKSKFFIYGTNKINMELTKKSRKKLAVKMLARVVLLIIVAVIVGKERINYKNQLEIPSGEQPPIVQEETNRENAVDDISLPVEISTPQQLADMSADYAVNGHRYGDRKYVLTNDIDMAGIDNFVPIGANRGNNGETEYAAVDGFCSRFDGQGYTIKNLVLTEQNFTGDSGWHNVALFDTIAPDGVVENLNVENININIALGGDDIYTCAGFAARVSGNVDNCHVQGAISNPKGGGGGFANTVNGYNGTQISNCSADVDITGHWGMGGFVVNCSQEVGQKSEFFRIFNCSSFGSITAQRYEGMPDYYDVGEFGGFADKIYGGTFGFCHMQTPIIMNDTSKYVGGFAANVEGDPITHQETNFINCTYSPTANGSRYLIGMLGWEGTKGKCDSWFSPLEK